MGRSRRGKRSRVKEQQRYVKKMVNKQSWRDRRSAETINVLTSGDILWQLTNIFEVAEIPVADNFSQGEVLIDSRGEGSLQKDNLKIRGRRRVR